MTANAAWHVYILQCADGTLYTGVTNNIKNRLEKHAAGTGAKYTRGRGPFRLAYQEAFESRSAAQQREAQIKRLNRTGKTALLAGSQNLSLSAVLRSSLA
jgi:putative endonuclease